MTVSLEWPKQFFLNLLSGSSWRQEKNNAATLKLQVDLTVDRDVMGELCLNIIYTNKSFAYQKKLKNNFL